jgi:hypothetical protein
MHIQQGGDGREANSIRRIKERYAHCTKTGTGVERLK